MKKPTLLLAAATAAVLCLASIAHAADLSRSDRTFFEKAAKSGMKEVMVSEAALLHLTSASVKEFAQMMITHHTKANEELRSLALAKGVTLPPKEDKVAKKWRENTKDVDDEYLKEMVDDHEDAIDLFEDASKSADSDIAAFAQKTLPTLRSHLEIAKAHKKSH